MLCEILTLTESNSPWFDYEINYGHNYGSNLNFNTRLLLLYTGTDYMSVGFSTIWDSETS